MIFKEFGNKNKPTIVLIHSQYLSHWMWVKEIEFLSSHYHIIAPILDGHSENASMHFQSIEKCANQIIAYIDKFLGGYVSGIIGSSIGAQITIEILSKRPDIANKILIENVLFFEKENKEEIKINIKNLNVFYYLIKKKWFAKLYSKKLNLPKNLFSLYFKEIKKINLTSLLNLNSSYYNYKLPNLIPDAQSKIIILYGKNTNKKIKKSSKLLQTNFENSNLVCFPFSKYNLNFKKSSKYIDLISDLFNISEKAI